MGVLTMDSARQIAIGITRIPRFLVHVLDTTAQPDSVDSEGKTRSGKRSHQMPVDGAVRTFEFEHGKPLAMPRAVALKFLKHYPAFQLTDADGNPKAFLRPPKQPHELQAGAKNSHMKKCVTDAVGT